MKKFIRTPFSTAPWTAGGWVPPSPETLSRVYKKIGNRALIRSLMGWERLRAARNLEYPEFRLLCQLAGIECADPKYSGSLYWKEKQREMILSKIHASRKELEEVDLSLDISGLDEVDLLEAMEEITPDLGTLDETGLADSILD